MANIALDAQVLEQLNGDQKSLFDATDDLLKHGVGQLIDLPQIIVVGDQSAGKSSVLEAISRVRFPIKDGPCTKFAPELVLRDHLESRINVQI
jgi:GTP1/Obg family GTP-binding protein